jgi:hypothetical protein
MWWKPLEKSYWYGIATSAWYVFFLVKKKTSEIWWFQKQHSSVEVKHDAAPSNSSWGIVSVLGIWWVDGWVEDVIVERPQSYHYGIVKGWRTIKTPMLWWYSGDRNGQTIHGNWNEIWDGSRLAFLAQPVLGVLHSTISGDACIISAKLWKNCRKHPSSPLSKHLPRIGRYPQVSCLIPQRKCQCQDFLCYLIMPMYSDVAI